MFPYGIDLMHVPGSSGEYSLDVFSNRKSGLEAHQCQTLAMVVERSGDTWTADICQRSHCMGHAGVFRIRSRDRTSIPLAESSRLEWPQQCTESEEPETDDDPQKCVQYTPRIPINAYFFPSNAFMAFARSFNMVYCMLQIRINCPNISSIRPIIV